MGLNFLLVEDDPVCRKMLRNLIEESGFGEVVGELTDGADVSIDRLLNVDIVLIDLLMPRRDGIETIRQMRDEHFTGKFVMISQIENKQMVEAAYLSGVEYFIHKPLNRLEIQTVLQRVIDSIRLTQSLATIRKSLAVVEELADSTRYGSRLTQHEAAADSVHDSFTYTFAEVAGQIGLRGESGAQDIERCLLYIREADRRGERFEDISSLQYLYQKVLGPSIHTRDLKAMEQRIRRAVLVVLSHLASLGLSDFGNPTFEYFAPRLFEFGEVRQRMKEIEHDVEHTKCKVSIRKFLSSLYVEILKMKNV